MAHGYEKEVASADGCGHYGYSEGRGGGYLFGGLPRGRQGHGHGYGRSYSFGVGSCEGYSVAYWDGYLYRYGLCPQDDS
jgi:hypothetical protein